MASKYRIDLSRQLLYYGDFMLLQSSGHMTAIFLIIANIFWVTLLVLRF